MDLINLDSSLERPPCPQCGKGRMRPVDIFDGKHLTFQCNIPECSWTGQAKLPEYKRRSSTLKLPLFHTWRALSNEVNPSLHGSTFMNAFEAQPALRSCAAQHLQSSRTKRNYLSTQKRLYVYLASLATPVSNTSFLSKGRRFFVPFGDIYRKPPLSWELLRRSKMRS